MSNVATIYDFIRMCRSMDDCSDCYLHGEQLHCAILEGKNSGDVINQKIIEWCEENPPKTRQSEFLKLFPNTIIINDTINICPRDLEPSKYNEFNCKESFKAGCEGCMANFWLSEVE